MPSCLHVSSVFHLFDFLFFDEPSSHSFFFAKTLPLPPSQFHSWKTIMVFFFFLGQKLLQSITLSPCNGCSFLLPPFFFFFGSKTLAKHYIVTVQWLLLSSSSYFFFFGQKNFIEALIAKMKFSPEIIQNIDASSTFDRMLWLKLQQWWFGVVSL